MWFQAALLVALVMLFGVTLSLMLGKPRPVHVDGWLHGGGIRGWRLERQSGPPPYTWHLDGIPFDQAPVPSYKHQCQPQTCSLGYSLYHEDRCACGAARVGVYGKWFWRNTRWDSSS